MEPDSGHTHELVLRRTQGPCHAPTNEKKSREKRAVLVDNPLHRVPANTPVMPAGLAVLPQDSCEISFACTTLSKTKIVLNLI